MSDKITRAAGVATILENDGSVVLIRRWHSPNYIDGTDMLGLFEEWRGQDVEVTIAAKGTDRFMNDHLKRQLRVMIAEWEARASIAQEPTARNIWLLAAHELMGEL